MATLAVFLLGWSQTYNLDWTIVKQPSRENQKLYFGEGDQGDEEEGKLSAHD